MLEREDFHKRFRDEKRLHARTSISLAQGYDSVGSKPTWNRRHDQKFNLLVGRELQRARPGIAGRADHADLEARRRDKMSSRWERSEFTNRAGDVWQGDVISDEMMWRYYELLTMWREQIAR